MYTKCLMSSPEDVENVTEYYIEIIQEQPQLCTGTLLSINEWLENE